MIRRALLSVSDKTGIVALARVLVAHGVELLSTGGTLGALAGEGIAVTSIEAYTGSPEVMAGRVKTLHPRVHGGILARADGQGDGGIAAADQRDLDALGGAPIDLVVCNLYPFEKVAAQPGASEQQIIENIDIGGPSMLRSAAKNHARVTVVCNPADYPALTEAIEQGSGPDAELRRRLASKVFAHTAAYDGAIAARLSASLPAAAQSEDPEVARRFPPLLTMPLERVALLRYGENPHQQAAWYRDRGAPVGSVARAEDVGAGAKQLSFNNLVDLDAALAAVLDVEGPAAAVIKHTNPCGFAAADELSEAYRLAREGDPQSAFGGIVALNRVCDLPTAEVIAETFIECVVAPDFDEAALGRLRRKKRLRLVKVGGNAAAAGLMFKRIGGGFVVQDRDRGGQDEVDAARLATKRAPTEQERAGLRFAWLACKHVKSNAIVLARPGRRQIVGVGAGQMSRVDAVRLACEKAGDRAEGSVMASDAFFPFPDGVEAAVARGATAVVQPGGSVKDAEVIAAADQAGIAMLLTGVRHFRH